MKTAWTILLFILTAAAITGAYHAKQAAHAPRVIIKDLIVVVDSSEDAEAVLSIMRDMMGGSD
jgi:hypothetical protein